MFNIFRSPRLISLFTLFISFGYCFFSKNLVASDIHQELEVTKLLSPIKNIIKEYLGVYNWQTERILNEHKAGIISLAFSSKGKLIASASDDNIVKLWELETGNCIKTLNLPDNIYRLTLSRDRKYLAILLNTGIISIYDTTLDNFLDQKIDFSKEFKETKNELFKDVKLDPTVLPSINAYVDAKYFIPKQFSISPDNKYIFIHSEDIYKKIEIATGNLIETDPYTTTTSTDRDTLYNTSKAKDAVMWSIDRDTYVFDPEVEPELDLKTTSPYIFLSPISTNRIRNLMATRSKDENKSITVKFCDEDNMSTEDKTIYDKIETENAQLVSEMANLPMSEQEKIYNKIKENNSLLNVLSYKSIINISQLLGHTDIITSIIMSDTGEYIISGSLDKTIRIWRNPDLKTR